MNIFGLFSFNQNSTYKFGGTSGSHVFLLLSDLPV